MAVLDPVKLVIDNYPEDQMEEAGGAQQSGESGAGQREKCPSAGSSTLSGKTSWKCRRENTSGMFPGNEVRLMGAYFATCTGCEKDENGKVTVVHCTYDPETRERFQRVTAGKVKGTIHWVAGEDGGARRSAGFMRTSWTRRRASSTRTAA